jgi:hypothetical protein
MSLAATAPTTQHNYAAWLDGTTGSDLKAIEQAIEMPPVPQSPVRVGHVAERASGAHSGSRAPTGPQELSLAAAPDAQLPEIWYKILAEREGFEPGGSPSQISNLL